MAVINLQNKAENRVLERQLQWDLLGQLGDRKLEGLYEELHGEWREQLRWHLSWELWLGLNEKGER